MGPAQVDGGVLVTSFGAYQPRTFALKLSPAKVRLSGVRSMPVALTYDVATASNDGGASKAGFDGKGDALPAEMLPANIALPGAPSRTFDIRLWSPSIAPDNASATVAPPAGLKLGSSLPLDLFRPTATDATGGGAPGGAPCSTTTSSNRIQDNKRRIVRSGSEREAALRARAGCISSDRIQPARAAPHRPRIRSAAYSQNTT